MASAEDLFATAPEEVIRYVESKSLKPSFDWRDVAPEEHAYALTVAKSAGYDILDDVKAATVEAATLGGSFESFRSRLEPVLREKGWWGRGLALDDKTGKYTTAQLGSVRRLRIIYWANTSSAKAAGEWERIQRTKKFLPFLQYLRSTAENKRPLHASWAAQPVVLPVDHSWWRTHYPPNGWMCQCSVRQVRKEDAEGLGWSEDTQAPEANLISWKNKRTGQTEFVPAGIDPGWHSNPGIERGLNVGRLLSERLEQIPPLSRKAAIADITASPLMKAIVENRFGYSLKNRTDPKRSISTPVAVLPEILRKELGSDSSVVHLSLADAVKIGEKHPEVTSETYRQVQTFLESGKPTMQGDKLTIFYTTGRSWWAAVIKRTNLDELFLNSLYRTDKNYVNRRLKR